MNAAEQAAVAKVRARYAGTRLSANEIKARIIYGLDADPVTTWPRSVAATNPLAAAVVAATRKV